MRDRNDRYGIDLSEIVLLLALEYTQKAHVDVPTSSSFTSVLWSAAMNGNNGGAINAFGGGDWPNTGRPDIYPSVNVQDCKFVACKSTGSGDQGSGGGICCWYAVLSLERGIFEDCTAHLDGGGVCVQDGELHSEGCTFTRCSAERQGSAVAAYWKGQEAFTGANAVDFHGCTVSQCTRGSSALYFYNLTSLVFVGNDVTESEGSDHVVHVWSESVEFNGNKLAQSEMVTLSKGDGSILNI